MLEALVKRSSVPQVTGNVGPDMGHAMEMEERGENVLFRFTRNPRREA